LNVFQTCNINQCKLLFCEYPAGDLLVAVYAAAHSVAGAAERIPVLAAAAAQDDRDAALAVVVMLGNYTAAEQLLQCGANPATCHGAALMWADRRGGELQQLLQSHHKLVVKSERQDSGSSSSSNSNSVGAVSAAMLAAVAAWCSGLHQHVDGVRPPGAAACSFTLQQYLQQSSAEQRTVACLLQILQQQCSWLFLKVPISVTAELQLLLEQQFDAADLTPAAAAATQAYAASAGTAAAAVSAVALPAAADACMHDAAAVSSIKEEQDEEVQQPLQLAKRRLCAAGLQHSSTCEVLSALLGANVLEPS
jgi:hypothetical protein